MTTRALAAIAALSLVAGCCPTWPDASPPGGGAPSTPTAGHAHGHVVGPDGKPIHVAGAKVRVGVTGTSMRGENVGFSPAVDANGDYDVKVPEGNYRVSGNLDVTFDGKAYVLPLDPVQDATVDQSSEKGVVQDFSWKLTGVRKGQEADPRNFTHWYGCSVSAVYSFYREDLKKPVPPPPPGVKVTFTLTPKGPLVDGSEGKPLTFERAFDRLLGSLDNSNLPDIPLGVYTITGTETHADGKTHPLLFQTSYAHFAESTEVRFAPGAVSGAWPCQIAFTRPIE